MRTTLETIAATILVPGFAVFLFPYLILRATGAVWRGNLSFFLQILAVPAAWLGGGMAIWVSYTFATTGRGTPIPLDPPKRFIAGGLFRYVRNPMVLGVLIVLIAEAVFFRSGWLVLYAAAVWGTVHVFVVVIEEPQLARRFGEPYLRYRETTPRWIPRPPRAARRGERRKDDPTPPRVVGGDSGAGRVSDLPSRTVEPVGGDQGVAAASLERFFLMLHEGSYPEAAALFAGSFDPLRQMNPDLAPNDLAGLLHQACAFNGYQCLRTRSVTPLAQEKAGSSASRSSSRLTQGSSSSADRVAAPPRQRCHRSRPSIAVSGGKRTGGTGSSISRCTSRESPRGEGGGPVHLCG